ncbi:MAG: 16S rRNA (guanine(966)-N(2))-methyltransferase RsmD [Lawsonella sp.]
MRIVAGQARGRRLFSPPNNTRPTSDRVREALFNSLNTLLNWPETTVLDLYAGSGAVGLEAASRGARHITLVEKLPAAVSCVRKNKQLLGEIAAHVEIHKGSAQRFLEQPAQHPGAPYDFVFMDPPYDQVATEIPQILTTLIEKEWVGEGSVVVLERSSRDPAIVWPAEYEEYRSKNYGETAIDIAIVSPLGRMAA